MRFFSAQRAHWNVADLKKPQLISGDDKTFRIFDKKNKFISGDKKIFFQLCFFACFFSSPLLFFFQIDQKFFFISSPSLTLIEICPIFFYLVILINFFKNRLNVFFFLNVFFTALPH